MVGCPSVSMLVYQGYMFWVVTCGSFWTRNKEPMLTEQVEHHKNKFKKQPQNKLRKWDTWKFKVIIYIYHRSTSITYWHPENTLIFFGVGCYNGQICLATKKNCWSNHWSLVVGLTSWWVADPRASATKVWTLEDCSGSVKETPRVSFLFAMITRKTIKINIQHGDVTAKHVTWRVHVNLRPRKIWPKLPACISSRSEFSSDVDWEPHGFNVFLNLNSSPEVVMSLELGELTDWISMLILCWLFCRKKSMCGPRNQVPPRSSATNYNGESNTPQSTGSLEWVGETVPNSDLMRFPMKSIVWKGVWTPVGQLKKHRQFPNVPNSFAMFQRQLVLVVKGRSPSVWLMRLRSPAVLERIEKLLHPVQPSCQWGDPGALVSTNEVQGHSRCWVWGFIMGNFWWWYLYFTGWFFFFNKVQLDDYMDAIACAVGHQSYPFHCLTDGF